MPGRVDLFVDAQTLQDSGALLAFAFAVERFLDELFERRENRTSAAAAAATTTTTTATDAVVKESRKDKFRNIVVSLQRRPLLCFSGRAGERLREEKAFFGSRRRRRRHSPTDR